MTMTTSRAERRNLTVLFADLVGSSGLAARLDPEDLQIILRSVQGCFREAISKYEGEIARYLGDGVLAYFGFPVAHEDAAERAVSAALAMRASVSELSFPDVAAPLQLHIGIATGLVLVGDLIGDGPSREFELIGEAPNLAAWLQQHAKPDQILISPHTRVLLHEIFKLSDEGECRVKGHAEPVRVWEVLQRRTFQTRFDAYRSSKLTSFVGRDPELGILLDEFGKAERGEGSIVNIYGEAGIGKSRLIDTFCEKLGARPFRRLVFQCSSHHSFSPWYPVIRHLEDTASISGDDTGPSKFKRFESFLVDELREPTQETIYLLAKLVSLPTPDTYPAFALTPQQQKRRTLSAVIELFRAQATQALLLIFEDIHWIDPTSLELLELAYEELKPLPVMMIASFRPEFEAPWARSSQARSISLGPLGSEYAASVVNAVWGDSELPPALVARIVERSDGVPLFIEEVTKAVFVNRTDVGNPALTRDIPDTLHDSLMARLDRLADAKTIVQVCATVGREFDISLLQAITSFSIEDIRRALSKLIEAGLLIRHPIGAPEVFVFKHALVQQAAYTSMLRRERQKLHSRIAEILCARFPEIANSSPETVARHYREAAEYKWAVTYWIKAGQEAVRSSAFIEAIAHFQAGLQSLTALSEDHERDRLELQLQQSLASAFIAAKGFGAAETFQAFDRALELSHKIGDGSQVCFVLNGLASVHYMRGNFERAHALSRDLLERASQQRNSTAVLMGRRILGMSLFAMGELSEARLHLEHALELYDQQRHAPLAVGVPFAQDLRATAQVYLGLTLVLLDQIEEGLRHGREALAHAEQLRHPHWTCPILVERHCFIQRRFFRTEPGL